MAREHNRLTAAKVAALSTQGRYADGGGLWLQISRWGTKSWLFRFQLAGRARQMGLGPVHTVTLAEARERARQARRGLLDGIDPIEAARARRDAERLAAAARVTFRQAAERYIAAHSPSWKNPAHAAQWPATLEAYAYPIIGALPVADVDTGLIMRVLEPIWTAKPETASRVRGRIELVLDWATARHHRSGENPARWRGHLDKLLPAKTKVRAVRHQPAMAFASVPAFVEKLRQRAGISARALEFTILTAARTGEAIGARWSEIDFAAKVWTVPAERMKSSREHRVPLSEPVVALLEALPREAIKGRPAGGGYVFPGGKAGKGLSNMAMLRCLADAGGDGLTVHGFRSSFRDFAAERTGFPREIAEAALAHALSDKTEAAYRRGDALEKRRRLMRVWAEFCSRPATGGQVVAFGQVADAV